MKILVIDDDELVRHTMARILCMRGYDVDTAADGRRGVAEFLRGRPDIVVTDLIMPDQEGIETIRQIRRARPAAKILAISGGGHLGKSDVLELAGKLGADDVLAKPFDAAELIGRIERLLPRPDVADPAA